eukprot:CAMPEP_0202706438 /NCGR_PEP_ID=MMETSP1385-20130828/18864_1 /ASSEMBLY_ACC=CAM_ASM_000861 /TAXON_ID=933848 /ORGANISM="Elphidium margaritaceum" /LENGTH=220 /DNA_ID=CAMNT_0049364905 /DNA_START=176 /DNA_END=838 /DNA_ORIENTATION=+
MSSVKPLLALAVLAGKIGISMAGAVGPEYRPIVSRIGCKTNEDCKGQNCVQDPTRWLGVNFCEPKKFDEDCGSNDECYSKHCDTTTGTCLAGGYSVPCYSPEQCLSFMCTNNRCDKAPVHTTCRMGTDCGSGLCASDPLHYLQYQEDQNLGTGIVPGALSCFRDIDQSCADVVTGDAADHYCYSGHCAPGANNDHPKCVECIQNADCLSGNCVANACSLP